MKLTPPPGLTREIKTLNDLPQSSRYRLLEAVQEVTLKDARVTKADALNKLKPLLDEMQVSGDNAWEVIQATLQIGGVDFRVDADAVAVLAAKSRAFVLGDADATFAQEVLTLSAKLQKDGYSITLRGGSKELAGDALLDAVRGGAAVELSSVGSVGGERAVRSHGLAGSVEELALVLRQESEGMLAKVGSFFSKKPSSLLEQLVAAGSSLTFAGTESNTPLSGTEILKAVRAGKAIEITKVGSEYGERVVKRVGIAATEAELKVLID